MACGTTVSTRYIRLTGYGNDTNNWTSITELDFFPLTPSGLHGVLVVPVDLARRGPQMLASHPRSEAGRASPTSWGILPFDRPVVRRSA